MWWSSGRLGGSSLVVFEQTARDSRVSTIVLRGSTSTYRTALERALEDGINVYKTLTKDPRVVAGAGAFEVELTRRLAAVADATPGLAQYALKEFAEALSVIPRTLAEVSGFPPTQALMALSAKHYQSGVDVETELCEVAKKEVAEGEEEDMARGVFHGLDLATGETMDALKQGVVEPFALKHWALQLATDAAVTVLQIDQIIMSKPAGGPKIAPGTGRDELE